MLLLLLIKKINRVAIDNFINITKTITIIYY